MSELIEGPLERLANLQHFDRKSWHIDEEPTHLDRSKYNESRMPITGLPFWEESDKAFRERLLKTIPQAVIDMKFSK